MAKGWISKQRNVYKETKNTKFGKKTFFSNPLTRTRSCVYQEVTNISFSENLANFVFL